jgi:hypothetical protein
MGTQILVRTKGEPLAMVHSIRQKVASIDPDKLISDNVRDLEGWIQREPEYARDSSPCFSPRSPSWD